MDVLLLNPNTSADMTAHIVREAGRHSGDGIALVPATARFGGAVVASRASYAIAAHAVLDTYARHIAAHAGRADAVVIACFGDPGLEALRELAAVPVIGLLESAVAEAARVAGPFGIVTAGPAWVPMLEERVRATPHAGLLRGVFAIQTTGLDVTRDPGRFAGVLQEAVDAAVAAGAGAVILGGSALAGFGPRLSTPARLIDPLEAAMAEARRLAGAVAARPEAPPIAYEGLGPELAELLRPPATA
ncbi:aspartate/glutamate racemase family protein [Castellaniella sp. GW247-6E4]|uniref:aspartate/glutamate racemase family protein n=1 Tax=Castellaniella sp. GW247-6E4 TaxID=3140380 RepID=UPI003315D48E